MHEAVSTTMTGDDADAMARPDDVARFLIHTPDGFPGFDSSRQWAVETEAGAVFSMLHNLDLPGVGLLLAEPWELALGYEPDFPDEELSRIGVHDARDVEVYVVATIAPETNGATSILLNLAAPIVVNARTRIARQVILDRQGWPMRHAVEMRS